MVESSNRDCLAHVLAHHCYKKKLTSKPREAPESNLHKELDDAQSLVFDSAYKKRIDKGLRQG